MLRAAARRSAVGRRERAERFRAECPERSFGAEWGRRRRRLGERGRQRRRTVGTERTRRAIGTERTGRAIGSERRLLGRRERGRGRRELLGQRIDARCAVAAFGTVGTRRALGRRLHAGDADDAVDLGTLVT